MTTQYTALNALAELDKFPAFKRELAELIEASRGVNMMDAETCRKLGVRLTHLGAAIELRNTMSTTENTQ